ncbi:MAG: hypothetical protein NZ951_06230 [Dehalococcoidia bacterium]|nr:hypothetical protein [Dehalococcoidia bacterium]MDW8119989.1 hypothetical protein [Chloroflexota bacterium]
MHPLPTTTTSTSHHPVEDFPTSPREVAEEVLGKAQRPWPLWRALVLALGVLLLLGVVGLVLKVAEGTDHTRWGYYAAVLGFLYTTAGAAPIVSVATRMAKAHWRRPLARIAEVYGVVGLWTLLLYIPLVWVIPPGEGRNTIWIVSGVRQGWPPGAPVAYDLLTLVMVALSGLALLWIAAIPDLAALRDQGRGGWTARLALGWRGTLRQWRVHKAALSVAGGLYFIAYVGGSLVLASDLVLSFVPGWKDSIFPAYHALSGLQAGLALVVVSAFVLRTFGGYQRYFHVDQFWGAAKLLLALSLLWAYFNWSAFLTFWYGRTPTEQNLQQLLYFGPYRPLFVASLFLNWLVPLLAFIISPVRRSIWGPTVIGLGILVGAFVDRVRLYVGAWSVPDPTGHHFKEVPAAVAPTLADYLLLIGGISGGLLLALVAARLFLPLSVWELKELTYLRVVRPFLKTRAVVLGKPD